MLGVLCAAAEYDELPVRHNEDKLNLALARDVRLPTDPRAADDPHTKANALLQAHFSRAPVAGDLAADQRTVVLQAVRLLQVCTLSCCWCCCCGGRALCGVPWELREPCLPFCLVMEQGFRSAMVQRDAAGAAGRWFWCGASPGCGSSTSAGASEQVPVRWPGASDGSSARK